MSSKKFTYMLTERPKLDPAENPSGDHPKALGSLLKTLERHLGTKNEPGKSLSQVALDLAQIVSRVPPEYGKKVEAAWERVCATARVIGQGDKRESVQEQLRPDDVERLVKKYSAAFIGKRDMRSAAASLRTVLKAVASMDGTEPGTSARSDDVEAGDSWKKPGNSKAQSIGRDLGKHGKGGEQRKIRDELLAAIKVGKLDMGPNVTFGRNMARAANAVSAVLADHPASSPEKVKNFTKAWKGLVSLVGGYMEKKPGLLSKVFGGRKDR